MRRVVVTGLGATTPIGGDVQSSWSALLAGTSGVRTLTEEWASGLSVHFAARVAQEPSEVMERVEMRRLDRSEQFALIASREAWKDAGSPVVDNERLGVVIASGIGGVITLLDQHDVLKEKAPALLAHTLFRCLCQMDQQRMLVSNSKRKQVFTHRSVRVHQVRKQLVTHSK